MPVEDAKPPEGDASKPTESENIEQQAFKPVLPDPGTQSPLKQGQESPVKVKIYPYFDKLERGGKCLVAIELTIADGWHINANPSSPDFTIPTEVKITSKQKIKMTRVKYPKHELLEVEGQDEPSHVYGGRVIIYALLEIAAEETANEAELEVEVKVQACNSKTCEPPETKKLVGKRPLANPGDEIKRIHESKFPKDGEKDGEKDRTENRTAFRRTRMASKSKVKSNNLFIHGAGGRVSGAANGKGISDGRGRAARMRNLPGKSG